MRFFTIHLSSGILHALQGCKELFFQIVNTKYESLDYIMTLATIWKNLHISKKSL